jgi:hypothetical protein
MKFVFIFNIFLITNLIFGPAALAADDPCERWFLKSGVKAGTDNCEINCAIIPSDMGTFDCSTRCEDFCKTYVKPDSITEIAKYVETRTLTPSERSLIAKYPIDALKVYRAKQTSTNSTKRIFGGNFRNDESDAYRHFMWSGLIQQQIGRDKAEAFLNAHEVIPGEPDSEGQMDKFNNDKGIAAADKLLAQGEFSQDALEKEALQSIKNGDLNVLNPTGRVPAWKK